ncbi:D-aspartate oxidase [Tupaia chinensis]|uniref:D-aspartate oxidase n=1 Tax=Tupaia chinensis TaxID=246437 RepID=L9JID3_TUPCH|nr:D-aspartate oxidase [Tupaia chinensis]
MLHRSSGMNELMDDQAKTGCVRPLSNSGVLSPSGVLTRAIQTVRQSRSRCGEIGKRRQARTPMVEQGSEDSTAQRTRGGRVWNLSNSGSPTGSDSGSPTGLSDVCPLQGHKDPIMRQSQLMNTARIAVVGAGVMGLSTAVCISKLVPGCSITIIAEKRTPDTTSDVAAGVLIPHAFPEEVPFWADVVLGFRKMTEAELKKFPHHVFGQAFTTLKCEGSAYLPWLENRVKRNGGLILTRRVEDLWELHPSFDIVVNCSGLGSRQLMGDSKIFPVRGQVLKVQAPWVKHFIREGSGLTYIYPGAYDVTLGGTRQKGDWNLSPDAKISRDILSRCCALEPSLHRACSIKEKVGLRPSRPGVRLQKELLVQDGRRLPVVHHYGHGSGGISVHWGTALEAARLVRECVLALKTSAPKSKL